MRIRGRSLPFPPLLPSPPTLPSDPSAATNTSLFTPKTGSTTKQPTGEVAPVKIEQALHPNGDLLQKNCHASQYFSPSSSASRYPAQVQSLEWERDRGTTYGPKRPFTRFLKEEAEEEKWGESVIEFRSNARAQVGISNRATICQDKDQEKLDCTMMKDEQKEGKTMVVKEKNAKRNQAVLSEGSRCSRVNGRGWRCCQPTLVGYLLCEHHLGKGRMRNMTNATRGQLGCTDKKRNLSESTGSADEAVRKKRSIVPTVKARSISSLLDDGNGH